MFEETLADQLNTIIGQVIEVTTQNNLFEGVLIRVLDGLVELTVFPTDGYEREVRSVTVPLTSISYIVN